VTILTHGPLVGATTDNSVVIWLRADGEGKAVVRLAANVDRLSEPGASTVQETLEACRDYTAVFSFNDLKPDTTYHYTVQLNGEPALPPDFDGETTFRTFPSSAKKAGPFSFAFGSCFIPKVHTDAIFNNLTRREWRFDPRFFLMIGDNIYVDKHIELRDDSLPPAENLKALYREAYRESWKHETFRRALMRTPSYMIFDDHEIWDNWNNLPAHQHDREGLPAAKKAYWEYQDSHNPEAIKRHQTAEPTYYYTFSYGQDVGFFVLDCRMRRNPTAVPYPTILGDEQRQALYNWLRDNKTKYRAKFVISSVPISFIALPHTIVNLLHGKLGDQWLGYPAERLELFKFIQHEQIEGVHFLSGDIHLGQALVIEPKRGSSAPIVYSYTSSPLANIFHLLPDEMPGWFSTVSGVVIGLLAGYIVAFMSSASVGWGLIFGLLGGLFAAWLWRKWKERRGPQIKVKPGKIEGTLYWLLGRITHFGYMRKLMGVAADKIKGRNVHYVPDNLFTAVHGYNMGIVTVDRDQQDGSMKVQFELVNADGVCLGKEKEAHPVLGNDG